MTRRVKVTTREYAEPEIPHDDEVIDEGRQTWENYRGRFLNGGARVKIYRKTDLETQYCFPGTPEQIDEEYLRVFHARQPYHAEVGNYIAAVQDSEGRMFPPFPITIAPQPGATAPNATVPSSTNDVLIRMLQEQNARLESMLHTQDREPVSAIIDGVVKLDGLRGGNGKEAANADLLIKGIEIGKQVSGTGGTEDWKVAILDTVREALPVAHQIVMSMLGKSIPAPEPASATDNTAPNTQVEIKDMTQAEEQALLGLFAYLKQRALQGSNPDVYAALVEDGYKHEPIYQRLVSEIIANDFQAFAAIDPEIDTPQFRQFFKSVYNRLRSRFSAIHPVAAVSGGENGNNTNAAIDEAKGKRSGKR